MKIINRMQIQSIVQNQLCKADTRKNEAPEHLHDQMKRSTRGIYMFVSQKNKLIEDTFPDGDVLHIEKVIGRKEFSV